MMNLTRFKTIIEAYGAKPTAWPTGERRDIETFIQLNAEARQMLAAESKLDHLLDSHHVSEIPGLAEKIRVNLPQQPASLTTHLPSLQPSPKAAQQTSSLDWLMNWLFPDARELTSYFKPALVAAIPLIAGIYLGTNFDLDRVSDTNSWDDEIYLLTLNDNTEVAP